MFSVRTKESIKTALAMTIAYGIALSMDWDRPYWAGFAVAFVSLSTVGQSLNKGAMRMLGSLVALPVSLALIALFLQERWAFMAALSALVGYCTYRMGSSRQPYFWFVLGFVTVIICVDGGAISANTFETAVLRAQETGLGILVYSLVAVLLWPTDSRASFAAASTELAAAQQALYNVAAQVVDGAATPEQAHTASTRLTAAHSAFVQALQAATIDTYEVWELRRQWQHYQQASGCLINALAQWRESLGDAARLDLHTLLPGLAQASEEFAQRLASVESMLAGKESGTPLSEVNLDYDRERIRRLPHFDKAAFAVMLRRLRRLDGLTRELYASASDIGGFGAAEVAQGPNRSPTAAPERVSATWLPDPDNLTAALRAMAGLWAAYLIWIYVEIPGGSGFVAMAGPFSMVVATNPRMRVMSLLSPVMLAIAFATLLYVFVMPQLSGFLQLGTLIFLTTFIICYRYAAPAQAIGRAFGLAMFVTIAGISNEQSYNFLSPANTAVMVPIVLIVLAFVAWFPHSSQPEKVYLRLLRRFFRSSDYLMNTLYRRQPSDSAAGGAPPSAHLTRRLHPWLTAFHHRELVTLPTKLSAWSAVVGERLLPDGSAQPLQTLNIRLHALTPRLEELLDAGGDPQAEFLVRELLADARAWRLKVQQVITALAADPASGDAAQLQQGLAQHLQQFDQRIRETLNKAADGAFDEADAQNFYRLLGAYRGVSEALVDFTADAERIDWPRWRENRF